MQNGSNLRRDCGPNFATPIIWNSRKYVPYHEWNSGNTARNKRRSGVILSEISPIPICQHYTLFSAGMNKALVPIATAEGSYCSALPCFRYHTTYDCIKKLSSFQITTHHWLTFIVCGHLFKFVGKDLFTASYRLVYNFNCRRRNVSFIVDKKKL